MEKFITLFYNECQGFSMHPYPVESLDGGDLLIELLETFIKSKISMIFVLEQFFQNKNPNS